MITAQQPTDPCGTAVDEGYSTWLHELLSSAGQLAPVLDRISAAMTDLDYSPKDVFGMRLAVEEAVVNSIKHGHKQDPTKEVSIRYRIDADCVLVTIEDQGAGFNPDDVPDPTAPENWEKPGGRGVFLMRSYTTWTRFNARGNRVTLCKYRTASSANLQRVSRS